ncbi:hypothetical protein BVRB_8g190530 [Beta vulgaris subsp. vulgaris]|nr:hypothetical protein BVRB_8g190530 [Beta vulgaris subsp. vulgaris]
MMSITCSMKCLSGDVVTMLNLVDGDDDVVTMLNLVDGDDDVVLVVCAQISCVTMLNFLMMLIWKLMCYRMVVDL